jgi:hypothetical protein
VAERVGFELAVPFRDGVFSSRRALRDRGLIFRDQPRYGLLSFNSMNLIMAVGAKRNQIFVRISAMPTAEANVVNLKILRGPTMLASPAVALKYLRANSTICCRNQPKSSQLQRFHCGLSICSRNSVFCGSGSSR